MRKLEGKKEDEREKRERAKEMSRTDRSQAAAPPSKKKRGTNETSDLSWGRARSIRDYSYAGVWHCITIS